MSMAKRSKLATPEICRVCGEDVPPRALACPECGADHNSGWREDAAAYDGAGLSDGAFDYEEFVREEFGGSAETKGISTIWWVTAIVLVVALAALWLYS